MAPPSILSSFSFSFALVALIVWHSTEGWYMPFSASDAGVCVTWDTPPGLPLWVGVKKFGWKALFVIPGWWSIILKVVAVLKPDSTFWELPVIVGGMVIFFSSIFEANSNVWDGPDPLFVPWGSKLSAGLSLFLCFEWKIESQFFGWNMWQSLMVTAEFKSIYTSLYDTNECIHLNNRQPLSCWVSSNKEIKIKRLK